MARKSTSKSTSTSGGAPSVAAVAARAAKAAATGAAQDIGLVSINRFDLNLWKKFVGLAKMQGKSIPEATTEALKMWIKENLKSLEV